MGRARRRIGAVLALLVIATACSSQADEPDRIAQRYSALAELAEALDLAGLCDEFKRSRSFAGWDLGRCHSRPEDFRGKRLSLRLTFFSDADEYDKRKRGDSSECGGPLHLWAQLERQRAGIRGDPPGRRRRRWGDRGFPRERLLVTGPDACDREPGGEHVERPRPTLFDHPHVLKDRHFG